MNSGPLPYQGSALPLSYYSIMSGKRGSNPRPPAWKASALSTELFPQNLLWVLMDSNHRSRKTADLQSAPFGHSGKHPSLFIVSYIPCGRASCRIRTNDPEITNHVLWPTELKRLLKQPFSVSDLRPVGKRLQSYYLFSN